MKNRAIATALIAALSAQPVYSQVSAVPKSDHVEYGATRERLRIPDNLFYASGPPIEGTSQANGPQQKKVLDKTFVYWASAFSGSAACDAHSTRYGVDRGLPESNPILRPFAHSNWATYTFFAATTGGLIYLGYKAKKNGHKKWKLPLVINTIVHGTACGLNYLQSVGREEIK